MAKISPPDPTLALVNLSLPFFLVCALTSFYLGPVALTLVVLLLLLQGIVAVECFDRRHKAIPWLMVLWAASVVCAVYIGSRNYHKIYGPYRLASKGRDRDVPANALASGFRDGGMLSFDDSFLLDGNRAIGIRAYGGTYCAAPVVSARATEGMGDYPVVQFWAVGQDCCGARGDFFCDDAGETGVHGGVVLHDPSEDETLMGALLAPRLFDKGWHRAIEASCALYEMQSAREPVLVAWAKRPDKVLTWWRVMAVAVWLLAGLLHLLAVAVAWTLITVCLPEPKAQAAKSQGHLP